MKSILQVRINITNLEQYFKVKAILKNASILKYS